MAGLALGLAGAAIGNAVIPAGIPLLGLSGGALGFTAGSALANLIFGGGSSNSLIQQQSEGPRLNELKVTSSAFGAPIPRIWGSMRVGGNIIWTSGLMETEHRTVTQTQSTTETEGGKGFGGGGSSTTTVEQTTISYTYSVHLAMGLTKGPIGGVRKIWANGTLIYNAGSTDFATTIASAAQASSIRVYLGNETQTADPLMQSFLGSGNVPAHRGLAYIVFDNLQLSDFGNRIPNIEVEVVYNPPTWQASLTHGPIPDNAGEKGGSSAFHMGRINSNGQFDTYNVALRDDEVQDPATTPNNWLTFYKYTWVQGGFIGSTTFNRQLTNDIDRTSINDLNVGSVYSTGSAWATGISDEPVLVLRNWSELGGSGAPFYDGTGFYYNIDSEKELILTFAGDTEFGFKNTVDTVHAFAKNGRHFYIRFLWGLGYVDLSSTGEIQMLFHTGERNVRSFGVDANGWYMVSEGNGLQWFAHGSTSALGQFVDFPDAAGATMTILYRTDPSENVFASVFSNGVSLWQDNVQVYSVGGAGGSTGLINIGTHYQAVYGYNVFHSVAGGGGSIDNHYFYSVNQAFGSLTTPLSTIVSDICQSAGLAGSEIDVTDLSANVRGYIRPRPMVARSAIEPLQKAFFFDAVESDNKIEFVTRGNTSVVSIPSDDLKAVVGSEGTLPPYDIITRQQELELPKSVKVTYIDRNLAYDQGEQYEARLITNSQHEPITSLPVVLTASEARSIASSLLFNAWAERESHQFVVGPEYSDIEPTDVVTVVTPTASHVLRVTSSSYGFPGPIVFDAVPEESSVYSISSTGGEGESPSDVISTQGPTFMVLLDIPILRDVDDNVGFYIAASSLTSVWNGAVVFMSLDGGENYAPLATVLVESDIGLIDTPPAAGPTEIWDRQNTLTVTMLGNGALSSVTESDVLNGANVAAIGDHGRWEIINFVNATDLGSGQYQLDTLLRGRRGTDNNIGSHVAGDKFVLLTTALKRVIQDSSLIGISHKYKAVSLGTLLQHADPQDFANAAEGKEPYSPAHLKGVFDPVSEDFDISWVRRGRVSGEWRDLVNVPLGESSELYDLEIYDANSSLIRTVSNLSSPVYAYTKVTYEGDGFTKGLAVTLMVYQKSDIVGRGDPATLATVIGDISARYWRLLFTDDHQGIGSFQICEIEFHEAVGGSQVCVGGTESSSSVWSSPTNDPDKALDQNNDTIWLNYHHSDPDPWWKYDFGAGNEKNIVEFVITANLTGGTATPEDFELQWSENDSDWNTVKSIVGAPSWGTKETRVYEV